MCSRSESQAVVTDSSSIRDAKTVLFDWYRDSFKSVSAQNVSQIFVLDSRGVRVAKPALFLIGTGNNLEDLECSE